MQSHCGVATAAARLSHYKDGRRNDLMGKCCMETKEEPATVAMTNALSASRTDKCGVMHGMAARHRNRGLFLSKGYWPSTWGRNVSKVCPWVHNDSKATCR